MSNMLIQRYKTNNGYRCDCCRQVHYEAIWIERKEMIPFCDIVALAYSKPTDGYISLQYENNGEVFYGFRSEFTKTKYESYIIIGENEYCILAEGSDKAYITKEELDELYWNHVEKLIDFSIEEMNE